MVDEDAFWRQIEAAARPENKLVFADWLEEAGNSDLAFAMRWAGKRDRHPARSPKGRYWAWGCSSPRANFLYDKYEIPRIVFDRLRPARYGRNRAASLPVIFTRLAAALAKIRREIE